jgi:hypothetical protein
MKTLVPLLFAGTLGAQEALFCTPAPSNPGTLLPVRSCIEDCTLLNQTDLCFSLDFLYWIAFERGLDYAWKNSGTQFNQSLTVLEPDFEFEPAFRLSGAYHTPLDNWDLSLTYTYFGTDTTAKGSASFNRNATTVTSPEIGMGLMATWIAPFVFNNTNLGSRWQLASANWKLRSHYFDLLLKNRLTLGQKLVIEPAYGLKMALIHQTYRLNYDLGNTTSINTTDDQLLLNSDISLNGRSYNIGPEASFGTTWHFGDHWNFYGRAAGSLLSSHFDESRSESDFATSATLGPRNEFVAYNQSNWTFRPQAEVACGLTWATCIKQSDRVLTLALSAGYELQYYWKQNMFLRSVDGTQNSLATIAPAQGDLSLQGLTLDLTLDF